MEQVAFFFCLISFLTDHPIFLTFWVYAHRKTWTAVHTAWRTQGGHCHLFTIPINKYSLFQYQYSINNYKQFQTQFINFYKNKIFDSSNKNMKRTCCSHKDAQFVCISEYCKQKCSYICSIPNDQCKLQHEACSIISLNYVTKKCNKIVSRQKNLNMKELQRIYDLSQKIVRKLQSYFEEKQNALKVKDILDCHGLFQEEQKQVLIGFIGKDRKKQGQSDRQSTFSSAWVQKQLSNLSIQISLYLKSIKEDLRILQEQEALRDQISVLKNQSRIRKPQQQRKQKPAIQKVRSQSKGPTPVRGSNNQFQSPARSSKINSTKVMTPGVTSTGFQAKLLSVINSHHPKGPLFSKITNDIQTLQTFFYQKFNGANLLFRASENGFLTSKFHQKCDGVKNTLTILITEHDKIIGGFTPLPWRSNGDWYEDETLSSFIFSLTSGERFPLSNKSKAIWCNHAYGPSFGHPDLEIANKAFCNENSCVNFPQFYNNGNYTHSTKSIQFLCGTKTGHFRIKEWEVYELEF